MAPSARSAILASFCLLAFFEGAFAYQVQTRFDSLGPALRWEYSAVVDPAESNSTDSDLAFLDRLLHRASPEPSEIYNKLADSVPDAQQVTPEKTLLDLWLRFQNRLGEAFQTSFPAEEKKLRTLVVMPTGSSNETLDNFERNFELLKGNRDDIFHFALFHYHGNEPWLERSWYADERIVVKKAEPGCKTEFWSEVDEELTKKYDYVWLMDDDMSLSTFSWPLYKSVLLALDPIVSQPAILGKDVGERSSDYKILRMSGVSPDGSFPIAREVKRTEVQAPILSTKIWPAFLERLRGNDRKGDWYVSDLWDTAASVAASQCGKTGPLVVNASPLRHMNKHNLYAANSVGLKNGCHAGCGWLFRNCRPLSQKEKAAIQESLKGYCDVDNAALSCGWGIRSCQQLLSKDLATKAWGVRL